jgi:hypothetical protein
MAPARNPRQRTSPDRSHLVPAQPSHSHELARSVDVQALQALQRRVGNRAVARLIESGGDVQRKALTRGKLNIAGESHPESGPRRADERAYAVAQTGGEYWTEGEFTAASSIFATARHGDPYMLRAEMLLAILKEKSIPLLIAPFARGQIPAIFPQDGDASGLWDAYKVRLKSDILEIGLALARASQDAAETTEAQKAAGTHAALMKLSTDIDAAALAKAGDIETAATAVITKFAGDVLGKPDIRAEAVVSDLRSKAMNSAATDEAARWVGGKTGVWKVGNAHIAEMLAVKGGGSYEIMTKDEFNADFGPWDQKRKAKP